MINFLIEIFYRVFGRQSPSRIIYGNPKKWEVRQMEKYAARNKGAKEND